MSLLGPALPARSTTIGPDSFGYTATDQVPFSFVDISTTGTRVLAGADQATYTAGIGFTFDLYGADHANATISANGYLQLPPQGTGGYGYIYVLADDWQFYQAGADAVYFQTVGSPGSQQFIVQWNKAFGYSSSPSDVTFEVVLFEHSGTILFQYLDTDSGDFRGMGGNSLVGIQAGSRSLYWSSRSAVIASGQAIFFDRTCGNGVVDAGEECDDGNTVSCDGCSGACQTEPPLVCGDGVVVAGCEACDDGNLVDGDGCDSNCTPSRCGNGIVAPNEGCDDGNTLSCDGCSARCETEVGLVCGDGILGPTYCGERCDDGNLVDGDGCDSNCTPTGCGNRILTAGEQCDDGNTRSCDGCSATCQTEVGFRCGDGVVNLACEACDDGNRTGGDGCDEYCRLERCFTCIGTAPSVCTAFTACTDGDTCCPEGCTHGNDADCSIAAPLGPEFQVNSITAYKISYAGYEGPDVAADAAGNFVVVWRDYKAGAGYYNYGNQRVLARHFDNRANPRGTDFVVGRFTAAPYTDGRDIAVASNAEGKFVVVWGENYHSGGQYGYEASDVIAKRFSSGGTPLSGAFVVNAYTPSYQENPRVALGPAGDFMVIWNAEDQEGPEYGCCGWGLFGRRFDSTGHAQGNDFQINTTTYGDEGAYLAVAADPTGNFVVVWGDPFYATTLRGQRFDSAGMRRGGEFNVSAYTTGYAVLPAVTADASGNFVVAWQDDSDATVFTRRFNSAGNPDGADFQVNTFAPSYGIYAGPVVAADPTGNFLVVWSGGPEAYGEEDIFARYFDATGTPQGGEFLVNSYVTGRQRFPVVAPIGPSEFAVVWTDYGGSYYQGRVVGRRVGLLLPQDLTLAGARILIRNAVPENKERNLGSWTVTDPGIIAGEQETVDDPRCNGAPAGTVKATLRFFSNSSGHDTGQIGLPCQNWTAIGLQAGYKYQDRELDDGPCKLALVRSRRLLRALCLGSGPTTDFPYDLVPGTDEGTVNVVLTIGQIRYCAAFGALGDSNGSSGKLFKGRKAPPPASCPP